MNRSFFFKDFKYWLKINRNRFIRNIYIRNVQKNYYNIYFQGLEKYLVATVKRGGEFSIWALTPLEIIDKDFPIAKCLFDWIGDFDLYISRDHFGRFYWNYEEEKNGIYSTRTQYIDNRNKFYVENCWEPFLKWTNEKLISGNEIRYFQSYVKIVDSADEKYMNHILFKVII